MMSRNGTLLVDKPASWTSHDVVGKLRGILRERRIGHAGTLDPMATGLLVIAVGPSTRLLRYAQDGVKHYVGTALLGIATDSLDADGVETQRRTVPALTPELLTASAERFIGNIEQIPPMVSAIKIDGQKLYDLARQGIEVERAPRPVTIHEFTLALTERADEVQFSVKCSPGTYVRTLLADCAEQMGTVGHLTSLRRIASGANRVDDALTMERLTSGEPIELASPADLVAGLASVVVSDEQIRDIRHGKQVRLASDDALVAALSHAGDVIAVVAKRGEWYQPETVLAQNPAT
jgi:tRNA pseudouridine55 synthase